MANIGVVRLKLVGCGEKLDLECESSTTVAALMDKALFQFSIGGLSRHHIKLLYRGKQLGEGNDQASLESAGIRDRTKLILMHTKAYHEEKAGIAKLSALEAEIDALDPAKKGYDEFLTQMLCKLDGVDTAGSDFLRAKRKAAVVRIEKLSAGSGS